MKIDEIMTRDVHACRVDDTLAEAARIMWEHDCGAVPVVEGEGRVVGMITDRDVCMAAYTQGALLAHLRVGSAMSKGVHSCLVGDDLSAVERIMKEKQVRRLPVLDSAGLLRGIVSINDLTLEACGPGTRKRVPPREVAETLAAIGRHRNSEAAAH